MLFWKQLYMGLVVALAHTRSGGNLGCSRSKHLIPYSHSSTCTNYKPNFWDSEWHHCLWHDLLTCVKKTDHCPVMVFWMHSGNQHSSHICHLWLWNEAPKTNAKIKQPKIRATETVVSYLSERIPPGGMKQYLQWFLEAVFLFLLWQNCMERGLELMHRRHVCLSLNWWL